MGKTITVASRVHTSMRLTVEGKNGMLHEAVINGSPHGREAITEDVDADVFYAWMKQHPDHPVVTLGLIREVDDRPLEPKDAGYGDPSVYAVTDKSPGWFVVTKNGEEVTKSLRAADVEGFDEKSDDDKAAFVEANKPANAPADVNDDKASDEPKDAGEGGDKSEEGGQSSTDNDKPA